MGFSRQVERARLKKEYAAFKKAWNSERGYQRYLKGANMELPPNQRELGRCPTFRQFVESVRPIVERRALGKPAETSHDSSDVVEPDRKIEELQDLEWEDQ